MARNLYTELAWLPLPPADFNVKCRALLEAKEPIGTSLQALANAALDENHLHRLAKVVTKSRGPGLAPLTPFKLGLISNATTDFMVPALVATALRFGIALECIQGHFDQPLQEALDPKSVINRAQPDAVLISIDYRGLPLRATPGSGAHAEDSIAASLAHLNAIRDGIKANSQAVCIFQTLARPVESQFGSFDMVLPGTLRNLIARFNNELAEKLNGTEDLLLDIASIAETVGLANWHNPTLWNMGKLPFDSHVLPLYADFVGRLLGSMRGKSRRCLILDLDNTVWGGIIGDDGIEGIVIGQGNATGEAHLSLQQTALSLRERGIVLAVSSKNTDEIARTPFQKHPEMLLREEHFAVFQANWNDKATNIKAIAAELNLGLDAMVFVDDNPMERDLVRSMLPQVAVPEMPLDPAFYARTLIAGGYFEAIAFSNEDRTRADFYSDNARRVALKSKAGDVDSYLKSLEMVMTIQPFDDVSRARISQLINKSNQYNLTTRRYTETEVKDVEFDANATHLQIRLKDSFGDNGMISVIICRENGSIWDIDTWLMSCRVLGRKVEFAALQELVKMAQARGVKTISGMYRPTERNKLVEDHYTKLGFKEGEKEADGTRHFTMAVADFKETDFPMTIQRLENNRAHATEIQATP